MIKKLTMIAGALFALALTSCNKSSEVPAPVLDDTLAIVVDGVLDEAVYGQMPEWVTGVKAGVTVTYAASKEGVYFGLHVKDSNFQVSPSSGVVASDYVGIAVDAKAIPKGQDGVSEYTRLFRIDIMGRYTYTVGKGQALHTPGAIVAGHGVFAFGRDAKESVYHATVLEEIARIAYLTETLPGPNKELPKHILEKHYERKHGKNATYGQKK